MAITGTGVGVGEAFSDSGSVTPEMVELMFAQWEREQASDDWEAARDAAQWRAIDEALAQEQVSGWAAEELAGGLAAAGRGLDRAGVDADELVRVFDASMSEGLEAVGRLEAQLAGVRFSLAFEAASRGLHTAVGLSLVDWLRVRCPMLSKQEACQVQDVVRAAGHHWGGPLAEAVRTGTGAVHRVAKVARTMRRLASSLDVDQQQDYAKIATGAATNPGISDQDLDVVCQKLLIDLLDEKPRDEAKATAQELRRVTSRPLGRGMTRFTVDAPAGDAGLIDGVLCGPLAAPTPAQDGTPDPRMPGQRKYDAFWLTFNRGTSNPGAPPSSARASVIVTVKADPATGRPEGAAVSSTGAVMDAAQAGRLACVGDVTPIVLGEHGQPLALGRTVRLATPGQFKALMVRDGQCTYPGCSVPGTWCDSHHLIWWCRGGGTDLELLVLLCPRHHTLVHDQDLMATITGSVVTWHV
ncbi:HNH endonuclease signature motif containing protein [Ornithinimicrobium cryptoxanthini]|uniref:HNH endonuclease signature motif containing protein n=1 Tax=Ornithinimicrobium cryptoxanthini TaxID=2934161 RepID=UPI00211803FB|nr:HNH endonuclease signature motif containing protein [Ornithinimicrobium cryptoxanthini]